MSNTSEYRNPLTSRYASSAMSRIFSEIHRAELFRDLWIYLAEEEKRLGLPITSKQVSALKRARNTIDLNRIRQLEKELRHDVMSHMKAFGEKAKVAEPILHLGATSAYLTDNADVLILREAAELVLAKLGSCIEKLADYIHKWKGLKVTGFTHFQPAQPVTLGKRLSLWTQDFIWDAEELEFCLARLRPLGCKGATGTQASFLILFDGDFRKVQRLDEGICTRMGFDSSVPVSGQILSRKVDIWFLNALSSMAASFSKMSYDLRLMQHLQELREPFGKKQVGSSAMAYKRNPVLAERISSLARFLMTISQNATWTHATQWLERSLDDSANRRIVVAESFLAADALCEVALKILDGLEVDEEKIGKRLEENSALFETEEAMMRGTLAGGSRQDLHEKIRKKMVKGKIRGKAEVFSGAAQEQASAFHNQQVKNFLKRHRSAFGKIRGSSTDSI